MEKCITDPSTDDENDYDDGGNFEDNGDTTIMMLKQQKHTGCL